MKKFITGFIVGALIFSVVGAFAATYVAQTVEFKVLVNGEEFESDPPALAIEGRTYLPLRAIGDALGVPVEWNTELGRVEVGDKPVFGGFAPYKEKSWCPDFGKFAGISIWNYMRRDNGEYAYFYKKADFTDDTILKYCNIFVANGYETTMIDGGYVFTNADKSQSVLIGIESDTGSDFITILVH